VYHKFGLIVYQSSFLKVFYSNIICRPEDYKMVDSNPESEDNKENVDLKEEEIAGKFLKQEEITGKSLKYCENYVIEIPTILSRFYFPISDLLIF
jgi:hypothetical protein